MTKIDLRRGDFEGMHPKAKLFGFDEDKKLYTGDGVESINHQWTTWCACIGMLHLEVKEAQAVPNAQQALHDRLLVKSIREHVEGHISEISVNDLFDKGWLAAMKCIQNNIDMLEAESWVDAIKESQEPTND